MLRRLIAGHRAKREARSIDRANERAWMLIGDRPYDVVLLCQRKFLRVTAVGGDITRISAQIENLLNRPLRVLVKPGTYFVALGDHQNMATTADHEFVVAPGKKRCMEVAAVCINGDLRIPTNCDGFNGVKHVEFDLARFIEAADGLSDMARQAGVWAISDRMPRYQIMRRLAGTRDGEEFRPIRQEHVDEARELLHRLDIENGL